MRMLKAAVEAARGMPVMVDSGFRRGTDILKALALGARAVFVGRPFLFAAAYAGAVGVQHAIRLLTKEVDKDMALLGLRGIEDVSDNILLPVVSEQAISRQTA
jgi:L-lactate dehydrogenase (cytochrome)